MEMATVERERHDDFLPRQERVWPSSTSETERIRTVYAEMGEKGIRSSIGAVRDQCLRENVWNDDQDVERIVFDHLNMRVAAALPDKRTRKASCEAPLLRVRVELAEKVAGLVEKGVGGEELRRAVAEFRASGKR